MVMQESIKERGRDMRKIGFFKKALVVILMISGGIGIIVPSQSPQMLLSGGISIIVK